jgi:hypothetical protein
MLLEGRVRQIAITAIVLALVAAVLLVYLRGPVTGALANTVQAGNSDLSGSLTGSQPYAWSLPWTGTGTGSDVESARRYSGLSQSDTSQFTWIESWIAGVRIEQGIPGFVLWNVLFMALLAKLLLSQMYLAQGTRRYLAIACAAYVLACYVSGVKGQPWNIDPADVYIWLAIGAGLGLIVGKEGDPLVHNTGFPGSDRS